MRNIFSQLEPSHWEKLLSLLLEYELLFDGTLGYWNRQPISIELKEGAKPYHGRTYLWEYLSWISLCLWLSICRLERNLWFWIPQKVFGDLLQRSHFFFDFFISFANLKTWLPIHQYPSPCICMAQCQQSSQTFSQFIRPSSLLGYTSKRKTDCV